MKTLNEYKEELFTNLETKYNGEFNTIETRLKSAINDNQDFISIEIELYNDDIELFKQDIQYYGYTIITVNKEDIDSNRSKVWFQIFLKESEEEKFETQLKNVSEYKAELLHNIEEKYKDNIEAINAAIQNAVNSCNNLAKLDIELENNTVHTQLFKELLTSYGYVVKLSLHESNDKSSSKFTANIYI